MGNIPGLTTDISKHIFFSDLLCRKSFMKIDFKCTCLWGCSSMVEHSFRREMSLVQLLTSPIIFSSLMFIVENVFGKPILNPSFIGDVVQWYNIRFAHEMSRNKLPVCPIIFSSQIYMVEKAFWKQFFKCSHYWDYSSIEDYLHRIWNFLASILGIPNLLWRKIFL